MGWEHRPHHPLHYRVLRSALSTDVLFAAAEPRELSGVRLLSLDETGSLHNPQNLTVPFAYDVVSDTSACRRQRPYRVPPRRFQMRFGWSICASRTRSTRASANWRAQSPHPPPPTTIAPRPFSPTCATISSTRAGPAGNRAGRSGGKLPLSLQVGLLRVFRRGHGGDAAHAECAVAPAVNGFQTGSYNRFGKDFVVRARDAHSWVEVYFTGYGWVPFDPTPADPHPVLPGEWDDYVDTAALFWNEWIINYDFGHQVQLAREVEQDSRNFQQLFRQRSERL